MTAAIFRTMAAVMSRWHAVGGLHFEAGRTRSCRIEEADRTGMAKVSTFVVFDRGLHVQVPMNKPTIAR